MPTKRRQESSTGFYHVIVKGINKERIFNQRRERIYFKKIILKYLKNYQVEIYAYCIMSNHAHIMIRAEIQELSMFMARILAEYASYYNYKYYRNGHVFQNRFTSECIENEAYFWNCIRYIHMNPVKANIVKAPLKYKYSSMNEYCMENPEVIHMNALYSYRERFDDYKDFEKFHYMRRFEMFKDIPVEVDSQQLEVAMLILEEMFARYQLKLKREIFEQQDLREEYFNLIQKIIGISARRCKEVYSGIRSLVDCEG